MKLNLSQKKFIDEVTLQKIIKIGINFGERLNTIDTKCIDDFSEDKLYLKGEACYKDGYIYRAVVSTQGAWVDSRWIKVGDDITELDLDTIKSYLNLSQQDLDNLQNLIDDAQITLTKTHSSSKIYMDIQQCLNDSKTYTLKEISKLSGASYKVVTSTSEMTSKSIIYLLANATNYDMYIVEENGTATKIGDMDVDLSQYLTKSEIETDYLKKADADGKYATITTVDGKVDKTSIVDNLTSTDTDKPLSANQGKVLKDSIPTNKEVLDKLSENDDGELVYNGKVINTSMYISEETSEYNTKPNDNVTLYFTILGNKMTIFVIQRPSNDGKTIGIKYPLPFKSLPTITRTFGTPSGTEQTTKNTLTEWAYDQNYGGGKQNELHFMIQGTI